MLTEREQARRETSLLPNMKLATLMIETHTQLVTWLLCGLVPVFTSSWETPPPLYFPGGGKDAFPLRKCRFIHFLLVEGDAVFLGRWKRGKEISEVTFPRQWCPSFLLLCQHESSVCLCFSEQRGDALIFSVSGITSCSIETCRASGAWCSETAGE